MSPSYMAPPIKKQRGGAADGPPPPRGPPVMDPAQRRAQQLASLRQGYANRPAYGPPPGGPPRAGAASGPSPPIVGFNPGARPPATAGGAPAAAAPLPPGGGPPPPTAAAPPVARGSVPNFTPAAAAQANLFPKAAAAAATPVARRLDASFREAPPRLVPGSAPPAAVPPLVPEAPPPKEAPVPPAAPKHVAFAPTPQQSSSAPVTPAGGGGGGMSTMASSPEPVTSPPPQTTTTTPFGHARSHPSAGKTPFPGKATAQATPPSEPRQVSLATPFAPREEDSATTTTKFAGITPHFGKKTAAALQEPQPPSSSGGRRRGETLALMRNVADTPPSKQPSSQQGSGSGNNRTVSFAASPLAAGNDEPPAAAELSAELRLQKQLTHETKLKEQYLRQIAALQDEITDIKRGGSAAAASGHRSSFVPPTSPSRSTPLTPSLTPPRRRTATPHPKLAQGEQWDGMDGQFLDQATEDVPFKFEIGGTRTREEENGGGDDDDDDDDAVDALFVVRRPYGYGDMDRDLWFAAGEKNAKLYKRDATIEKEESIEVAVQIGVDDSVLLLYGEANVRHQNAMDGTWNKFGNYFDRGDVLGSVAYIDTDANEKEYSLDKLVEQAMDIRTHYCASLRNMAIGLQRRAQEGGDGMRSPPTMGTPAAMVGGPGVTPAKGDTSPKADACVGTEDMKYTPSAQVPQQQQRALPPPMPEEPTSDAFSLLIGLMMQIIWFPIKTVGGLVYGTVKLGITIFFVLCIYLWMVHNFKWTGVAPPLHFYHNPPGIM